MPIGEQTENDVPVTVASPVTSLSAAREMCARSGWSISNLELQKLLYLAQMVYMGEHGGQRLFNGRFEAWELGPVLPDVYRRARVYVADPVQDVFFGAPRVADPERLRTIHAAFDQLSSRSPSELVNITHWSGGAWAKRYQPGVRGIVIPDDDILAEARARGIN